MKRPVLCFILLAASVLGLSSCAVPRQVTFNEADFASSQGPGSGAVLGRAFMVFKNGVIQYGKNDSVDLVPVNAYTTEILQKKCIEGANLVAHDPRYDRYVRSAPTDALGHFAFHHLPPGHYYVATTVYFTDQYYHSVSTGPGENDFDMEKTRERKSQWIYIEAKVKNGETVRITEWNQGHTQSE